MSPPNGILLVDMAVIHVLSFDLLLRIMKDVIISIYVTETAYYVLEPVYAITKNEVSRFVHCES